MWNYVRFRNKILQLLYKPQTANNGLFQLPEKTLSAFDEIENSIEEKITPLLSELFE
ncbi:MAG: hypothetical protein FWB96_00085 [Defluviitaleaceae bacterium]|nr:hypothetical protein [Defluviitaleaceae bacterium]MCL2262558.1 hypothetical protein [Defluviitaleaceae bacterium]